MGKPLPTTVNPSAGTPPAGDQANAVVSGTLAAVGAVSQPFCFYGAFNVSLWGSVTTTLTTASGSAAAAVASATGVAVGQNINSTKVPGGTTVAALSGTSVTMGGLTNTQIAAITSGADAAAVFVGTAAGADAVIQLEKSYDGGSTWLAVTVPNTLGTVLSFHIAAGNINAPVTFMVDEPEKGVAYRLNCTAFTSGTLNYRLSETGGAATTWTPR